LADIKAGIKSALPPITKKVKEILQKEEEAEVEPDSCEPQLEDVEDVVKALSPKSSVVESSKESST
jgi:hypothetical protein